MWEGGYHGPSFLASQTAACVPQWVPSFRGSSEVLWAWGTWPPQLLAGPGDGWVWAGLDLSLRLCFWNAASVKVDQSFLPLRVSGCDGGWHPLAALFPPRVKELPGKNHTGGSCIL